MRPRGTVSVQDTTAPSLVTVVSSNHSPASRLVHDQTVYLSKGRLFQVSSDLPRGYSAASSCEMVVNCSRAAWRFSTISLAMTSGSGRFSASSRLLSLSFPCRGSQGCGGIAPPKRRRLFQGGPASRSRPGFFAHDGFGTYRVTPAGVRATIVSTAFVLAGAM